MLQSQVSFFVVFCFFLVMCTVKDLGHAYLLQLQT